MTREQAILFIDGSNFYHSARSIGIATGTLNYQAMAHKLVLDRNIAGIRYYVGKVSGDIFRVVQGRKWRLAAGAWSGGIYPQHGR